MRGDKTAFFAELAINLFLIQLQISCIGPYKTRHKTGRFKGAIITVFNRGNIVRIDAQFALNIHQGFTKGRAFTAQQIAKTHFIVVKAFWSAHVVPTFWGQIRPCHFITPLALHPQARFRRIDA